MYNDAEIIEITLNAKAWLSKAQQEFPLIRETRQLSDKELELYEPFFLVSSMISLIQFRGSSDEQKQRAANWLTENGYQLNHRIGQCYVQPPYAEGNDYVKFVQN